ncbi:MAG: hypothetical protein KBF45_05050 [Cyclobacteriaceae bacterium]|jgi:hypothetical protein|nr:hypothetical protein [Cyclobacteriaceae bacterium]
MKVNVYSSIEEMKSDEAEVEYSPVESLIQCLNLLDFYTALKMDGINTSVKNNIDWIELKFKGQ